MSIRIALLLSLAVSINCDAVDLPRAPATLPSGLGVNIHFTRPRPGEMEQLAAAGFTFVRMDFSWSWIEKERGKYDWSEHEALLDALKPHDIRAVFILDYRNDLYDGGQSPHTDEGRKAFATWATAGVEHFKGRGILWEMYNEPNISQFWKPEKNPDDYVKLAIETGKAIKQATPDEIFIGPACSTMDFAFLETCFKGGVLEYFDAVSVHPYRKEPPETVEADYNRLRQMIDHYAPAKKKIPIYSGEWGYSAIGSIDEKKQGQLLARQWLTNIACDVPISIWYDWHDDGQDPNENEHHFGTVNWEYQPKPAYMTAQNLTKALRGYRFDKRMPMGDSKQDHVLRFVKGNEVILAAWTTAELPHVLKFGPVSITIGQTPTYIKPPANAAPGKRAR